MNAIQVLHLAGDIIQAGIGIYVIWRGWHMGHKAWDRTHAEWLTGQVLIVLGILLIVGIR